MTPEIRTLADDEKITEPGFYNISLDRHHSQPCDGPSVTSGVLRQMELATPADVWAFSLLNPERWERPETKALTLGRAMATYVEGGGDAVREEYHVMPEDAPSRPTQNMLDTYDIDDLETFAFKPLPDGLPRRPLESAMAKFRAGELKGAAARSAQVWADLEAKQKAGGFSYLKASEFDKARDLKARCEFWINFDKDPRDKLTFNDFTMIDNMGRALIQDVGAAAAMGGVPECTMAYRDEITGIWVLARPDTINFDGTVTDYKKMNTMGDPFTYRVVDQRIEKHEYHMQLALGAEALMQLGVGWPSMAAIVAQWDRAPHHVILREIDQEALRIGQWQNRRALTRFAECLNSGHWPGPGEDVATYQMSEWRRDMLIEQMNTEGLAP
ncbi:MAG: PD-(D/E)XK nuclease-like domain-containing protein [Pikeienuella sp.]